MIWRAATNPSYHCELLELKGLAEPVLASPPSKWAAERGPFGAACLSLKRVGWSFFSVLVLQDENGTKFPLTTCTPKMLAQRLSETWDKYLMTRAAVKLGYPRRPSTLL